ncbi:hypothetical protein B0H66DRAFT_605131 [Apodospora peruviana]|uniref:Uncharacterized protein n=1 Tax=Apodospora peruviana TaxID=516989 RepID=A0AAE0M2G5_9PEZI|nr:hypothetical protein B0H66DRAFT_605131 [Apodospora peruviana]
MSAIFLDFLNNVPAHELEGSPLGNGMETLYMQPLNEGGNYRLDKQGGYHNLQIQANNQEKSRPVAKKAPKTVTAVLVLEGSEPKVEAEEVRAAFDYSYHHGGEVMRLGTAEAADEAEPTDENKTNGKKDRKSNKSKCCKKKR